MNRHSNSDRTASANVIRAMRIMRQAQGMSCQKLSDQLIERGQDITRAVLTNQENGKVHKVTVDQVAALASIFGVAIDQMLSVPCEACSNLPPPGFTCNICGVGS